ncbi:MAG: hypothetical protein U0269_00330 [Polyangiales bacterium]
MVDDESPNPDPDDREESEDRAVILARRRMLIASAMTGLAVAAEGCDWLASKLGRNPNGPSGPEPCLNVAVRPTVCLQVVAPIEDAAVVPVACLSTVVTPQPCLSERPTPQPHACLRVRQTTNE